MSTPNGNRTPTIGLRYESDATRNNNWSSLDQLINGAFLPGSPLQLPPGFANPPTTGLVYGRGGTSIPSIAWRPVLPLAGGAMAGDIVLARDPTTAMMAVTKQYVDVVFATTGVYRGDWQVAANTPDLNTLTPAPAPGDRWMALTVDPNVPEFPPAGIPGIDPAVRISQGTWVQRNATNDAWFVVIGGQLTKFEADQYYVNVTGDTMSGGLVISMNGPLLTYHETNLINPGFGGMRWIRSDFTQAWQLVNDTPGRRFLLERRDLAGAVVDVALEVSEVTGLVTIANQLDVQGAPDSIAIGRPASSVIRGRLGIAAAGAVARTRLSVNATYGGVQDDPTVSAWHLALQSDVDNAQVLRQPPGSGTATALFTVNADGRATLGADPTQPLDAVTLQYADGAYVNVIGDTMTGNLIFQDDGEGVFYFNGSATYQRVGGALTLREDSTGAQPQIEDNNGTNRRDIIDTVNGDLRYVNVTGDTMTGALILFADPTAVLEATTKQYVDAADALLELEKVDRAGDTMTGALYLFADPTLPLEATTKQYVDAGLLAKVNRGGDTMTGLLILSGDPAVPLGAATKQYVDAGNLLLQTDINSRVLRAGDTMLGFLTLSADPTALLHATTKQYTDAADVLRVLKAGDTMTGQLTLPASAPVGAQDATPKSYVDAQVAAANLYQGTWQVAANVPDLNVPPNAPLNGYSWIAVTVDPQVAEVAPAGIPGIGGQTIFNGDLIKWNQGLAIYEHVQGSSLSRAQADTLYLALIGGTMTGSITLPADPTSNLEAATKQYVDNSTGGSVALCVLKAGDTMTGNLNLPLTPPTLNAEATNKLYVDTTIAQQSLYQGIWNVASNTPDLQVPPLAPLNGYSWICQTVNPSVPESPPVALPGVPVTTVIDSGWTIRWNGNTNLYEMIRGPSLSLAAAQGFFVDITGDTMTGALQITGAVADAAPAGLSNSLILDNRQGFNNRITGQKEGVNRWNLDLGSATTDAANAGSDFVLYRYADNGTSFARTMQINRLDGYTFYEGDIEADQLKSRHGTAGVAGNITGSYQLRMGYNGQGGSTYGHEIRTCHHGSDTTMNQMQFWLWQQTDTPSSAAPSNLVLALRGNEVTVNQPLRVPSSGIGIGDFFHGWEYNSTYNGEYLKSYQGKFGFFQANGSIPGTEIARLDSGSFRLYGARHFMVDQTDGYGIGFFGGAYLYKASGTGMILRCHSGNTQPQIEDNNGTNRRAILDTLNGDARYVNKAGDTMSGTLNISTGVNSNALVLRKNDRGNNAGPNIMWHNGTQPMGTLKLTQVGTDIYYSNAASIVELTIGQGGWANHRIMWSAQNSPPPMYFEGDVYARGVKLTSDGSLKRDVVDLARDAALQAFESLRPKQFRWKTPRMANRLAAAGWVESKPDPANDRLMMGFMADDMDDRLIVDQEIVTRQDADGDTLETPLTEVRKTFDLVSVVAVLVAKLRALEERIEEMRQ